MSASGKNSLHLILLGKTGVGKSATGNTILGEELFVSDVTQEYASHTKEVKNHTITIVDTRGLFNASHSSEYITKEMGKVAELIAPGPYALLLLDLKNPSDEERNTIENFEEIFGVDVYKHMIVVFTHGDELECKDKTIQQCIDEADDYIQQLISKCSGRYHVFNNMAKDETQVEKFLKKVHQMLHENDYNYYSCMIANRHSLRVPKDDINIICSIL